jgi:hypothetical protein
MAFQFRLEHEDGTPADPATLKAAVPNWRAEEVIALGPGRSLRVIETRLKENADGDPVARGLAWRSRVAEGVRCACLAESRSSPPSRMSLPLLSSTPEG